MFAIYANLVKLSASEIIYSDGTFYSCTTLFTQLYTLHASVDGTMFLLVYALLPNKSETTYDSFFSLLKGAVTDRQSVLAPEYWMLDFEVAARNSVENNFPETSLKGCSTTPSAHGGKFRVLFYKRIYD